MQYIQGMPCVKSCSFVFNVRKICDVSVMLISTGTMTTSTTTTHAANENKSHERFNMVVTVRAGIVQAKLGTSIGAAITAPV